MSLVTGSRYYWLHLDDISILLLPPPVILPSEIGISGKKSLGFGFGKFGLKKVLILENLFSEKSLGFRTFGLGKKVSVSKNLVPEKSLVSEKKKSK